MNDKANEENLASIVATPEMDFIVVHQLGACIELKTNDANVPLDKQENKELVENVANVSVAGNHNNDLPPMMKAVTADKTFEIHGQGDQPDNGNNSIQEKVLYGPLVSESAFIVTAPALPEKRDSLTFPYLDGEFSVSDSGVRYYPPAGKKDMPPPPILICSRLDVVAQTRSSNSEEWGRLLVWKDTDGIQHQWSMPSELLQGDGVDVRRELARMGLTIFPSRAARELLTVYIHIAPINARARCVDRLGWHGSVYVTPTESIGQKDELVVFQSNTSIEPAIGLRGTVHEWRDSVSALAAGNSRLVFILSTAFAAALLDIAGEDSGGVHLRGPSSSGKTTGLKVGASVWGDPNVYPRLWRATANGLEGLAAVHNDGLLILDELSQIDPKDAGEAAYLLANGQGKARASRTGAVKQPARWRILVLSSGEESLGALMAKAGKKTNAGQEIRLADIDADAGAGMGLFEELHGHATPASLALALKDAAMKSHGAVGMAWLHCLVENRVHLANLIADGIRQFVDEVAPPNAAGQVLRVLRRFGLIAVAGEIATHFELTGWQDGEAFNAAKKCFAAWLDGFGGSGNREERALLDQVRAFIEAHGASRFECVQSQYDQRIINRVGFYRVLDNGSREYLVLPQAFEQEVCKGFDAKKAAKTLVEAGWLIPGNDNRLTQKPRIPGFGTMRVYVLNTRMLEE